jgi:hypothetical protein
MLGLLCNLVKVSTISLVEKRELYFFFDEGSTWCCRITDVAVYLGQCQQQASKGARAPNSRSAFVRSASI